MLDIRFDLIIGLPSIKSNNLITDKFAYLFSSGIIPAEANLASSVDAAGRAHTTHPNAVLAGLIRSTYLEINPSIRVGKLDLLQHAEPWNENHLPADADVLDSIYIGGDDITKLYIRYFLSKFRDIFSKQLRPKPANIPPMHVNVDVESWENNPANHRPPCMQ